MQISPSILSADFANLESELGAIANADWAHVDVMDAHFVPNLTLGLPIVESLLKVSPIPIDCHLMIEDPKRWAPAYAEAGGEVVRSGNRWSMDRQVRMTAGSIALVGAVASQVGSKRFGLIPAAIGAGLSFSAVSNTCAMASVLAKMPWNRPAQERSAGDVIVRIPTGAGKRS